MSRKQRRKAAAAARPTTGQTPTPQAIPEQPAAPPAGDHQERQIRQLYIAKFQPADGIELHLVEEMINAQCRQRSLAAIEDSVYQQITSATDPAAAFEDKSKCLAAIERARKGHALAFNRALAALLKMRKAALAQPAPEATAAVPDSPVEHSPRPVPPTDDAAVEFPAGLESPEPFLDYSSSCVKQLSNARSRTSSVSS